jgi:broad specificity phosphatase PhoE
MKKMSQQIHFIRHAETTAAPGFLVGSTDVGLSATGRAQAESLSARLPEGVPCLCSPMLRTRETLEQFQARGIATEVHFDERLREIDFGDYEMKTFAEIEKSGVEMDDWLEYTRFSFPGGESIAHFTRRLEDVLHSIRVGQERQLLVLTHGGAIRTLLCLILGLDIKKYLLFNVEHGSWSTVQLYSQGGVLTGLNK